LVDMIGHDVMLGQGYMRLCLGMLDPLTERFYFSPAWAKHGCKDFRVSVPCVMSTPSTTQAQAQVVSAALSCDYHESLEDLMEGQTLVTTCIRATDEPTTVMPAPLAPGFPQTQPPTRAEYQQHRTQQAQRNAETKKNALETLATAQGKTTHGQVNTVVPIGVTYSIQSLQQTGLLKDGLILDASTTVVQQVEQLRASIKEEILKEVLAATKSTTHGQESSPLPLANQPSLTNPSIIRRVATAKHVQWDSNTHLPYKAPANWQSFGKPSYASVVAKPAIKSQANSVLKKTTSAARAAVGVAMATLVPSTSASRAMSPS